jgi:hypothetical protein
MAWQLTGTILIACNCDFGCPCNFNALPTYRRCEGGWIWHVEHGSYDATALDGMNFSVFAAWPGAIHQGGGRAVSYVDDRASDRQREAIATLVRGSAGGPWGIFSSTYDLAGPHPMPYDVQLNGERSACRIGDVVDYRSTVITNPVTGAEVHPRMLLPEGLVTKEAALLRTEIFRVAGDVAYDHSGQYAAVGRFAYTG